MTKFIRTPFANAGGKTAVPETDTAGGVNMTQGYTQSYSLDPETDPAAKRIEREKMNGLFNLITSAISEIQTGGVAFPYQSGAVALLDGVIYQSISDANTDTPPSNKWKVLSGGAGGAGGANYVQGERGGESSFGDITATGGARLG